MKKSFFLSMAIICMTLAASAQKCIYYCYGDNEACLEISKPLLFTEQQFEKLYHLTESGEPIFWQTDKNSNLRIEVNYYYQKQHLLLFSKQTPVYVYTWTWKGITYEMTKDTHGELCITVNPGLANLDKGIIFFFTVKKTGSLNATLQKTGDGDLFCAYATSLKEMMIQ